MIIKKYTGKTQEEAILKAKDDLGPNAYVSNVKIIKPKGIAKLFKKQRVELTAAIDDDIPDKKDDYKTEAVAAIAKAFEKENDIEETKNALEEKINSLTKLIQQQAQNNEKLNDSDLKEAIDDNANKESKEAVTFEPKSKIVELVRNQLIDNEVSEKYADDILAEIDDSNDKRPIDNILASVYQKIVLKLGEVKALDAGENKPKVVFFVGNTGVGKTTTMAKLASMFKLEKKMDIAMISVDTYRIAAIEQIKTYAGILNAPMEVVYTPEEMKKTIEKYKERDLIFVDTAGHSHKNEEQINDLKKMVEASGDYDTEIYLVVSATVKYNDLLAISKKYAELFDYKLIFTKLDETSGYGSILNLRLDSGKTLAYTTWGQNVPDDIGVVDPQIIAKKLLGGDR